MTAVANSDVEMLQPLRRLSRLSGGLPQYYASLTDDDDPILRVAGWLGLLDAGSVPFGLLDKLADDCIYGAVRKPAFDYFVAHFETALATRAASAVRVSGDAHRLLMEATLANDGGEASSAEMALYLETGSLKHLGNAVDHADFAMGWRRSVPLAATNLAAMPTATNGFSKLFRVVTGTARSDLVRALADHLASAQGLMPFALLTRANADLLDGDAGGALRQLAQFATAPGAKQVMTYYAGHYRRIEGEALHKLGDARRAYTAFQAMHTFDKAQAPPLQPEKFIAAVDQRAKRQLPQLPPSNRSDVVQMLGFPRSGTTLLENALAAHASIETFEEKPVFAASMALLGDVERKLRPWTGTELELFVAARARYYSEIDRLRRKSGASLLIDKMPIRSGDAQFIRRLFPEWRYIFSIRHPFDVVLSCFRQRFAPNAAMENFRTIAGGARLYDFCMTQWFGVHSMDDPKVHYVRYEELATDFRPVMEGTLKFLGLPWSDEVMDFAAKAEQRAAKTPSYQKVRQGLSVGVQTYWRQYDFLWQAPEAKPLHKWAEFFGYPTK